MNCPGCGSAAYVQRPKLPSVCSTCGFGQRYGRRPRLRGKPGRRHTRHVFKTQGVETINGERRERRKCTFAGCRAVEWREVA